MEFEIPDIESDNSEREEEETISRFKKRKIEEQQVKKYPLVSKREALGRLLRSGNLTLEDYEVEMSKIDTIPRKLTEDEFIRFAKAPLPDYITKKLVWI